MTATIHALFPPPADPDACLTAARKVLFSPTGHEDRDVRTACQVLISMGDGDDCMMALVALLMLDRADLRRDEVSDGRMVACYMLAAIAGLLAAALAAVLL